MKSVILICLILMMGNVYAWNNQTIPFFSIIGDISRSSTKNSTAEFEPIIIGDTHFKESTDGHGGDVTVDGTVTADIVNASNITVTDVLEVLGDIISPFFESDSDGTTVTGDLTVTEDIMAISISIDKIISSYFESDSDGTTVINDLTVVGDVTANDTTSNNIIATVSLQVPDIYTSIINGFTSSTSWTLETSSASFEERWGGALTGLGNYLYAYGGYSDSGYLNDVWRSSNGTTWTQISAAASWSIRRQFGYCMFDNKIWIMGGIGVGYKNDVWYSSDGITWTQATAAAGWSARQQFSTIVYDNKMWVIGGFDGANKNDVWYSSDGASWTQATASANFDTRRSFSTAVFDGKMWVIGGFTASGYGNDLWYSTNGVTWTQAIASAAFPKRQGHLSFADSNFIYVFSGQSSTATTLDDLWRSSDGVTFSQLSLDTRPTGREWGMVGNFDNKWFITGGKSGTTEYNDVWSWNDGTSSPININAKMEVNNSLTAFEGLTTDKAIYHAPQDNTPNTNTFYAKTYWKTDGEYYGLTTGGVEYRITNQSTGNTTNPAGSATEVQYNKSATEFGASSNYTFDVTTGVQTVQRIESTETQSDRIITDTLLVTTGITVTGDVTADKFNGSVSGSTIDPTPFYNNLTSGVNTVQKLAEATDRLASGGTPAGSDGQIQINDDNSFGATTDLSWDSTYKVLSMDYTNQNGLILNSVSRDEIGSRLSGKIDTDEIVIIYDRDINDPVYGKFVNGALTWYPFGSGGYPVGTYTYTYDITNVSNYIFTKTNGAAASSGTDYNSSTISVFNVSDLDNPGGNPTALRITNKLTTTQDISGGDLSAVSVTWGPEDTGNGRLWAMDQTGEFWSYVQRNYLEYDATRATASDFTDSMWTNSNISGTAATITANNFTSPSGSNILYVNNYDLADNSMSSFDFYFTLDVNTAGSLQINAGILNSVTVFGANTPEFGIYCFTGTNLSIYICDNTGSRIVAYIRSDVVDADDIWFRFSFTDVKYNGANKVADLKIWMSDSDPGGNWGSPLKDTTEVRLDRVSDLWYAYGANSCPANITNAYFSMTGSSSTYSDNTEWTKEVMLNANDHNSYMTETVASQAISTFKAATSATDLGWRIKGLGNDTMEIKTLEVSQ